MFHYQGKLSLESILNAKKEQKIKYGHVIIKIIFCILVLITYCLLRRFGIFEDIRVKGINPSHGCISDSAHMLFSKMHLTVLQLPVVRNLLQMMSSLFIDSAFIYMSFAWYVQL